MIHQDNGKNAGKDNGKNGNKDNSIDNIGDGGKDNGKVSQGIQTSEQDNLQCILSYH